MTDLQKFFQKSPKKPLWGWIAGVLMICLCNAFFIAILQLVAHPINVFAPPRGPNETLMHISETVGLFQAFYLLPLVFFSLWRKRMNFLKGLLLGAGMTMVGNLIYLGHSCNFW